MAAMGDLIREGKVRHWGLSNETSYGVVMVRRGEGGGRAGGRC